MDASGGAALGAGSRLDLEELAGASGAGFCQAFADQLARGFSADLVTVSALRIRQGEHLKVVASWFDGMPLGDFEYDARGAPCRDVVLRAAPQVFADRVQQLYPEDAMFIEENINAYAGVPLLDAAGAVAGLVQAAWRQPPGAALTAEAVAAMQQFARRLGAELASMQQAAVLAALARGAGAGSLSPRAALRQLAVQMQRAFRVRRAFIAEYTADSPGCYRVLACCDGGLAAAGSGEELMSYEGAPCAFLQEGEPFLVPKGLQEMFPAQEAFRAQGVVSYFGMPLRDENGQLIGHFALLHDGEMAAGFQNSSLIGVCAARAAHELCRGRAERRRRQAEQALLLRRKAESLGLLAGTIAHEFNNLLAGMQGRSELALAHLEAAHPAAADVQSVKAGLQDSARLMRQLLGYARGGGTPQPEACDLNRIVRETLALVPPECKLGKAVVLDLEAGELTARMDPAQAGQLLMQAVLNAVEAIGPGAGTVTVSTRRSSLGSAERRRLLAGRRMPAGPCVMLEVRDTGGGMARDTVARIFDPFFTTKPGGRGLGLAAAMGIISSHRGGLAVDSREGGGSTFRFYFPACEAAEVQAAGPAAAPEPRKGQARRILVVDDEDTVRRAVAGLLQLRGCEVASADGYDAALALIQTQGPFDGAVIDMSMPGRGGWETLSRLRQLQPGLNAVMMSGFAFSAAQAGYPELDGVQVLDKPFTKEKLYKALFR
ncbi:hybrid sensor histidine kinase/response regulator [Leisingera sp. ANG-M7]|uniref:hybrid sensor histidine kinase/response regulator n=1 Tax=Leisingera sp. ANG-M7 TaxID=1577902 RepID=UPI00057EADC7|nr:response regulator [Leisingera sp. ANG-M7]KIC36786.1 histidine kinase [Leisingera sp. ANG-M7]